MPAEPGNEKVQRVADENGERDRQEKRLGDFRKKSVATMASRATR
jgi:hypothetical protein